MAPLRAAAISVLQINVGKRCNQTCRHCHVDAGPDRTEVMPPEVIEACLRFLDASDIPTLDITGGAPELHPAFRDIVRRARGMGRHVMDRCNLTITRLPNYQDLPEFFAEHRVEIVASLPVVRRAPDRRPARRRRVRRLDCRAAAAQRARIRRRRLGPAAEPGDQSGRRVPAGHRSRRSKPTGSASCTGKHGVVFNRLYTITNMPISRYLQFLIDSGNLQGYMDKLVAAFNPATVDGLMCRTTLSVGWDGRLYDCDFNQMIELGTAADAPQTIFDATPAALASRRIMIGRHCFGCTAGAGSSCGGAADSV